MTVSVKEPEKESVKKPAENLVKVNLSPRIEVKLDDDFRKAGLTYTAEEVEAMTLRATEIGKLDELLFGWEEHHTLLWGYTQYDVAIRLKLKPDIQWIPFGTKGDVLAFLADRIMAIPTITRFNKIKAAKPFGDYWKEKYDTSHPICKAALQRFGSVDALGIIAVKAGTSRVTVNKVNRIIDANDPDMIQQCENGDMSITAAYDLLFGPEDGEPDDPTKDTTEKEAKAKKAAEARAKKKAKEVEALAKYSVVGFKNMEKLDEHSRKFFLLRWTEEHADNPIDPQELQQAIESYGK